MKNKLEFRFETGQEGKALQRLAREQMKNKILIDIKADLAVCELENLDSMQYLDELKDIICSLIKGGS